MVDGKVSNDDVEKMLSEIYRQANMEMDESAIRMMQEISREASKERRSQEIQRPSDVLSERNLRTMKTIEENQSLKRSEPPPSVEFSGSGSDDIEEPSSSFSRHSRSHSGSRSPSRSDSRSYSGSRSPSRSGSRSYSGSKSYSQSRSGSDSRSYSKSQSGSRRDSAYSDSRSHSRSAKSSSRSGDSRSSRASRGSQSRSTRSSPHSRDSRSYSRSRSPGDSRSSYSSRGSRSSGSSRSYYSQELSPKRRPEPLLPDQESKPEEGGNSWFSRYLFPRTLRSQSPSLNDKEDDDESEASAGGRCCTPAAVAFVLCILIAVGLGIGFGIDAANKAGGGDKDSQGVVGEIKFLDAKEYFLFGGEEMAVSTDVVDVGACIEFCREYDAMQYLNVQDSCTCYNSVSCLMPWGPKVDSNYLFEGSLYVKDKLEECSDDYCQAVDDNDGLCFTANRKDAKQYTVFGVALIEDDSTFASSERACLDKCANYDAASFVLPNICTCFDNPTCWAEWGGNVDTARFSGSVFSKTPLDICESDYCELNTEDSLCFTGNEEDCREYALYGDSLFKTAAERTGDLQACLDLCAPYDAAALSNFTDCECYNFAQCKARWGDDVDSSNFIGSIYTKRPLQECEEDFCRTVAPNGLCFTGNVQSYSSYSLFGNNLEEVATSNNVTNKEECLDFCRKQDAAQFLDFQDPKCKCFAGADCWLAWPADQLEINGVMYTGNVYSKKELQFCTVDYCSQFADSQLCARNRRQ